MGKCPRAFLPTPVIAEPRDSVFAVSWDSDGRELGVAPGEGDNTLSVWNVTDTLLPLQRGPSLANAASAGPFSGAGALSPNGRIFVGGATDGTVQLWDISDAARPVRIGAPLGIARVLIESVAISDDGKTLAAASDDGAAHLVDISDPSRPVQLATLPGRTASDIYQVVFSRNGRLLAAASQDGHVYLWDIAERAHPKLLAVLGGFNGGVWSAAFSPDNLTMAAGGR